MWAFKLKKRRTLLALPALITLVVGGLGVIDYFDVARPVIAKLREDGRNSVLSLSAHRRFRVLPGSLTLNLDATGNASAVDIWRAFFQAADTLARNGTLFDEVRLTHGTRTKYLLRGEDFQSMGRAFGAGENPMYLLRTLPEKLRDTGGETVFPPASTSLFGIGADITHISEAAMNWAEVSPSTAHPKARLHRPQDDSVL